MANAEKETYQKSSRKFNRKDSLKMDRLNDLSTPFAEQRQGVKEKVWYNRIFTLNLESWTYLQGFKFELPSGYLYIQIQKLSKKSGLKIQSYN